MYLLSNKSITLRSLSTCTLDTVPQLSRVRMEGRAIEAFTLSKLVKKVMESDEMSIITHHDDGCRSQGVGSYSVHGITALRGTAVK